MSFSMHSHRGRWEREIINKEFKNIKGPAKILHDNGSINLSKPHQDMDNDHDVQRFILKEVIPLVKDDIKKGAK